MTCAAQAPQSPLWEWETLQPATQYLQEAAKRHAKYHQLAPDDLWALVEQGSGGAGETGGQGEGEQGRLEVRKAERVGMVEFSDGKL